MIDFEARRADTIEHLTLIVQEMNTFLDDSDNDAATSAADVIIRAQTQLDELRGLYPRGTFPTDIPRRCSPKIIAALALLRIGR